MRISVVFLCAGLWVPIGLQAGEGASQTSQQLEKEVSRTLSVRYLFHLPEALETEGEKKWPLILFLHGAGERGDNLELVKKHGPPRIVEQDPQFPFIVASPQCPTHESWDPDIVLMLLDHLIETHPVDPSRVYLTGLSMGGFGTWDIGLRYPERFAAIAPICGGGQTIVARMARTNPDSLLKKLPVWAFHGARDPVVPLEESERMIEALKRIGNPNAQLTVYPDAYHDSWTETYENPKLYDWFLSHPRD